MMELGKAAELCYNITTSYLAIDESCSQIVNETQNAIKITRQILLEDVFTRWSPLNGEISFSYNGGKDCQVLLLLYLGCLWEFFILKAKSSQFEMKYQVFPMKTLPTVFIDQGDTFETLEEFITLTARRYGLSMYEPPTNSDSKYTSNMAGAFQVFLDRFPQTEAIVIGIRHTDPFGETLKPIQKTDSNWPQFMRLQPILHWKLRHIWSFLLYSNEPICGLYGCGFTSIGSIHNTLPNPYLERESYPEASLPYSYEIEHGYSGIQADYKPNCLPLSPKDDPLLGHASKFYPGWYLIDDSLERAGRVHRKSSH